jgi:hypothetical protein
VNPQALPVLGEPVTQSGPAPDQRFVGNLHAVPVEGQQAVLGQAVQHLPDVRVRAGEFRVRDASLGVLGALAERGQTQEEQPGQALLRRSQGGIGGLGGPGERVVDATGRLETGEREHGPAAPSPSLQQRVRQQREYAHPVVRAGHELGEQGALDRVSGPHGRFGDGPAQFVQGHRPDHDLGVVERRHQLRVTGTVGVEVGPHAQHHPAPAALLTCGGEQGVDEPGAFVGLSAEREDLLELVHHQQQFGSAGLRSERLPDDAVQPAGVGGQLGPDRRGRPSGGGGERDRALLQWVCARREQHRRAVRVRPPPGR